MELNVRTLPRRASLLAKIGAWSQLLLLGGAVLTIMRIQWAAQLVDLSDPVNVAKVTKSIERYNATLNEAFFPLIWGFLLAMGLLTLFYFALIKLRYRQPWAYYFSLVYGIVLLSLIPVGLPFGLLLIIYALKNHRSFFAKEQVELPAI